MSGSLRSCTPLRTNSALIVAVAVSVSHLFILFYFYLIQSSVWRTVRKREKVPIPPGFYNMSFFATRLGREADFDPPRSIFRSWLESWASSGRLYTYLQRKSHPTAAGELQLRLTSGAREIRMVGPENTIFAYVFRYPRAPGRGGPVGRVARVFPEEEKYAECGG